MVPRNFDTAKLLQMRGQPLRVQQCEFASPQMLHQRHERNLGSVGNGMKHRFTKESATYRDAVKSVCQSACLPGFDRVRVSEDMQSGVASNHFAINLGVFSFRAC